MGFKSTLTTMLLCLTGIGSMNAQPPQEELPRNSVAPIDS